MILGKPLSSSVKQEVRRQGTSMRQQVGQKDIEDFLLQVGRTRHAGRLYLTGGAALLHRGIRFGQTLDIDIQITIDPGNLATQVALV